MSPVFAAPGGKPARTSHMNLSYYPAFINLTGKKCVVVGGGRVAERKVSSLLKAGASVVVVSPRLTVRLAGKAGAGEIRHIERGYRKGDLKGAFMAVAATSDKEVNRRVASDAPALVNVVDSPDLANFIVPSVVRSGPLTIAVSTSAVSPALARTIRLEMESNYGKDVARFLSFLKQFRERAVRSIPDAGERGRILKESASTEMLAVVRDFGPVEARKRVMGLYKSRQSARRRGRSDLAPGREACGR